MSETRKRIVETTDSVLLAYDRSRPLPVREVVRQVVATCFPGSEADPGISYCVWMTVRRLVSRSVTRRFKDPNTGDARQMRFPGFDHLQRAYIVGSGDDSQVVPVELMTAEQLDEMAQYLEAQGYAKFDHAQEIRKYRVQQFGEVQEIGLDWLDKSLGSQVHQEVIS